MRIRSGHTLIGAMVVIVALASVMTATTPQQSAVSPLIFSHSLHVDDQEIECAACHSDVSASTTVDNLNLPSMDACADCHDVEDDEMCGQCHRDPEDPLPALRTGLSTPFNHQQHLELKVGCETCHDMSVGGDDGSLSQSMPGKSLCMGCHDGLRAHDECQLCHDTGTNLLDIHPMGWRHQHAEEATRKPQWCQTCHQQENYCVDCHRGDNPDGNIHDLNYEYTHGLDAGIKESDCARCHDRRTFCNACHESENRMPLEHSTLGWRTDHGRAARSDVENCASCHEVDDLTCARAGCHGDADGIRGTDPRIHSSGSSRLDSHGPWHDDMGHFCYTCHTNSDRAGVGFCGYCHGSED
jgi:predicted CXXCH cytochrome family protein